MEYVNWAVRIQSLNVIQTNFSSQMFYGMKTVMMGTSFVTLSRRYQSSNTSEVEMNVSFFCITTGIKSSINFERSPNTITIFIFLGSAFPFSQNSVAVAVMSEILLRVPRLWWQ
jgi:hypothetical protein